MTFVRVASFFSITPKAISVNALAFSIPPDDIQSNDYYVIPSHTSFSPITS